MEVPSVYLCKTEALIGYTYSMQLFDETEIIGDACKIPETQ